MKIKITGRHIDVSERLKEYAEKRISKLEKSTKLCRHLCADTTVGFTY